MQDKIYDHFDEIIEISYQATIFYRLKMQQKCLQKAWALVVPKKNSNGSSHTEIDFRTTWSES